MGATRTCASCEETFPETPEHFFHSDGAKRSKLRPVCKECDRVLRREKERIRRKQMKPVGTLICVPSPEFTRDQAWAAYLHNRAQ